MGEVIILEVENMLNEREPVLDTAGGFDGYYEGVWMIKPSQNRFGSERKGTRWEDWQAPNLFVSRFWLKQDGNV